MAEDSALTEAEARGVNRGWDAANYADAYASRVGGSRLMAEAIEASREAYPTDTAEGDNGIAPRLRGRFVDGFHAGYTRYFKGEWQDGSSRTEPDESWKQHALA